MPAFVLALLKKKAAGKVLGLLVSKTQLGASVGAMGAVVTIVAGWLGALYGRWAARPTW